MMKHIFLDTNIIIDYFADRKPFSVEAARLFNYSHHKNIQLYISAVSYNNIYYIIRQSYSHSATIKMLSELSAWADIVDVTKDIIQKSLQSDFKDFEDAIQYHCAKSIHKVDFFVTRNTKDYKTSTLPVLTPNEALVLISAV